MSKYGRLDEINQALADGQIAIDEIKESLPSESAIYDLKVQLAELQSNKGKDSAKIHWKNPCFDLRCHFIAIIAIADENFSVELKKQSGLREKT